MSFIGVNITCDTYECARKCAMKTIVSTQKYTTVSMLLKTILTHVSMGVCRGYETGTPVVSLRTEWGGEPFLWRVWSGQYGMTKEADIGVRVESDEGRGGTTLTPISR